MANLKEQDKWEDGVYRIEENDPVLGGENGVTNRPIKQLANRTSWLKKALELLGKKSAPKDLTATSVSAVQADGHTHKLPIGTTSEKGVVKLNSQLANNSEQEAATPKAVKAAYDKGVEAKAAADAAQKTANDGVSKANNAQRSADNAQKTANDGVSKANNAQRSADNANTNANGRVSKSGDTIDGNLRINGKDNTWSKLLLGTQVGFWELEVHPDSHNQANRRFNMVYAGDSRVYLTFPTIGENGDTVAYRSWAVNKSGDTMTGILRTVGIASKQFGVGDYNSQYDSGAPFMVEETGSVNRSAYHPFIKGRVRSKNHYGAALSFGYTTKQGSGDGFGRGIIQLIEDNGNQKFWAFEHNGDFLSTADVKTSSGASLNEAIQSDKISHATTGTAKNKVASEYALGELHKQLQVNEKVVWQGSSNNAITVNLPFENGVLFVCVTKSWGSGTVNNMWLAAPIGNSHDTAIGDQDAGGSAGDYDFSMSLIITKKGKAVTLTPGGARKPVIKKVVVVGV